ncbi:MAG: stage 0 sporulation family protein [Clostridia bacterium]|nr:stage 0 sporulation family protein [Clostridia bacterium]
MPKVVGVRFIRAGKVTTYLSKELELNAGDKVVVETARGLELGEVVSAPVDATDVSKEVTPVVRVATDADFKKLETLKKQEPSIVELCNKLIAKYKLDMKLVNIEFTVDGTKVIINYVCEDRVDFRDLVKELASHLKQRIELRQIGIRDQAKVIGAIGICGKECCCKEYLNDFDKVSIKMAKTQNLSLNPTKISGVCGRLMCCLAYENDFYSEIGKSMPKVNGLVSTPDGKGTVMYNNLLKQTVMVKIESDNDIKVVEHKLSDIKILNRDNNQNQSNKNDKVNDKNNAKPNKK